MKILLVEDEPKTIHALRQGLEEMNWSVDIALDGVKGKSLATQNQYDIIVSDITMPGLTGLEMCRQLRADGIRTPILMLTALGQTDDKITGLEAGADDYLAKPFEFRELVARIRALGRRQTDNFRLPNVLRFADLELNLDTKTASRQGQIISLTPREFALLTFFVKNQGRVLSKIEIAEKVWDVDFDTGTNVIEVYVNYLRNKVDKNFEPRLIHTQFGQGYIMKVEELKGG